MRNEACDASEVPGPPSRSSVHHAVTLLGIYWECARTDGMFWRARCIDIQRLICWVFAKNHSSCSREISGLVMQCNNVASWMCRLGYRLIPVVNVVFMSASCVCARSTVGFAHSRQCGNALGAINASIYMAFLLVSVTAWVQRAISISFFCAGTTNQFQAAQQRVASAAECTCEKIYAPFIPSITAPRSSR